ncbi:K2P1.1 [Mytilus edulis]|uniref:KCNK1 n=2 Tax=Mytilus TaxID=6548 RepID=A0A8S3TW46_MYTED|nr:K2P1.1 [Mytilus edulis]
MTTIGLGDYIPGDNPEQELRPLYKVATTCYLVIGLWAMMLLMSVLYDIPELNIGFHFYMKSDKDEDEERTALKSSIEKTGTKYTKHVDEEQPTAVQAETSERNTEQLYTSTSTFNHVQLSSKQQKSPSTDYTPALQPLTMFNFHLNNTSRHLQTIHQHFNLVPYLTFIQTKQVAIYRLYTSTSTFNHVQLSSKQHKSPSTDYTPALQPCTIFNFHPNNTSRHLQTIHQHFNLVPYLTFIQTTQVNIYRLHQHFNLTILKR